VPSEFSHARFWRACRFRTRVITPAASYILPGAKFAENVWGCGNASGHDYFVSLSEKQDFTPCLAKKGGIMSLDDLREQIDSIDAEIVALLNRRAEISVEVGKRKSESGNARYFAPERERDIMQRLLKLHDGGAMPKDALLAIYREIISTSIALQRPLTIAYWGPRGTFTEMAARSRFGSSAGYHDVGSIADIFGEVERNKADYGVVPVENSTEGVINSTLDMFHGTSLRICAEVYVTIVQNLATHATDLAKIKRLYTFSQPLSQCRQWVDKNLPHVEIIEVMPTSKAAERAAADPEGAGIVAKLASDVYNIPLLHEGIEDNPNNRTRFIVVGRNEPPPSGRDKTSILFAVKNQPGSLGRALRVFEAHNINLTMIASRPTKNAAWEYVQFVDFQGHEQDADVAAALEELNTHAIYVTVLGSYPEG
jgi:chorismate mutase/prephenate dehydratase